MKRVIFFCISISIFILFGAQCFAQSAYSTHECTGRYVYSSSDKIVCAEKNGDSYSATLEDVVITVKVSEVENDFTLIIHKITQYEEDAYSWFEACTASIGYNRLYYDIYFIDALGKRVDLSMNFDVSIKLPEQYATPAVYKLDANANITLLANRSSNGTVVFAFKSDGYIVVAERSSMSIPTTLPSAEPTNSGYSNQSSKPPKTGSRALSVILFSLILIVECIFVKLRIKET